MDQTTRFEYLLDRFKNGNCSEAETQELLQMLRDPAFDASLNKIWQNFRDAPSPLSTQTSQEILQNILSSETYQKKAVIHQPGRMRRVVQVFAVAASLVIILFSVTYFLLKKSPTPHRAGIVASTKPPVNRIVPGSQRAELILEDGSTVNLDSAENGNIAFQGSVNVKNINGRIEYVPGKHKQPQLSAKFNTLRTPKGGFYQLTLSDGTKLWLNAASSLRYPVAFDGKERVVELKGEGYFEVAKDAARPFRVLVNDMSVEVKGTHFNVMAYENETAVKTTLLEGSVSVTGAGHSALLNPGQQAELSSHNQLKVISDVNLDQVIAWKNGYFHFDRAGLEVLMRQIERWYDVDVQYVGKIQQRSFGGKISRSSNIRDVLKILELSKVSFRIENKNIIVSHQ